MHGLHRGRLRCGLEFGAPHGCGACLSLQKAHGILLLVDDDGDGSVGAGGAGSGVLADMVCKGGDEGFSKGVDAGGTASGDDSGGGGGVLTDAVGRGGEEGFSESVGAGGAAAAAGEGCHDGA